MAVIFEVALSHEAAKATQLKRSAMLFRKSREAKQQAAEEARAKISAGFGEQLLAARAVTDPAERLLKLTELSEAADALSTKTNTELRSLAGKKGAAPYFGISFGGVGTTALVVLLLHFPPMAALAGLSMIPAAFGVSEARVNRAQKRYAEEAKPFFNRLAEIGTAAKQDADEIIRDHLPELAHSPRSDELLRRVPRLRDCFLEAFMKGDPGQPVCRPPIAGKATLTL